MAAATLNPAIDKLDESSILYDLYTRLYDGMSAANKVDAPACVTMPPCEKNEDGTDKIDEDGALVIDQEAIAEGLQTYTTILMKNSAYVFANAIIATIAPNGGSGGGVSGTGFLARSARTSSLYCARVETNTRRHGKRPVSLRSSSKRRTTSSIEWC